MKKGSIFGYLLEIVLVSLGVLISIPIWEKMDMEDYYSIAKSYEDVGVIDYSNEMQD